MKIVADTNTFLAVALGEPERQAIIEITLGHTLVAPSVLPFEIGNAMTAMARKGKLAWEAVDSAWIATSAIPVELRTINMPQALSIAARFKMHAYDAYFLECALGLRLPLLTLDSRMKRMAQDLNLKTLEILQ